MIFERVVKKSVSFFVFLITLYSIPIISNAEEVILRHSFAGNISFELAGNSLRRNNNTCLPRNSGQSSSTITLPNNSIIKAAYLYWSGSGATDTTAVFDSQTVTADVSYVENFQNRAYFSSKADVTALVSNNSKRYTVGGITFDGSDAYCASGGAYGGWALSVIYENDTQPLRVINVFDGFKNFWGSEFALVPNNFVIAQDPATKGGKHAHITWEGDEGNSQSLNNQNESLRFEGFNLTDGDNPSNNQFNGFSNVTGRTSGVDIDEYEIGNLLTPGATSVSTTYSSGQDAVFLTAEFISVPNEPVADLSILQTGPSVFLKGQSNDVELSITNNGPNAAANNTQIIIPLNTGLSLASYSGNNWICSSSVAQATCNYQFQIDKNASASLLTLSLQAAENTADTINLVSTVSGILFDNILSNNTQSKRYSVVSANLTTSTKTVTDINGGNVQAGDVLRYRIDIKESNGIAASNLNLTDHLDANIASYTLANLPSSIINNSSNAPAGNQNSGVISLANISIAANGTTSIFIDATIKSSVSSTASINNTATLSAPGTADVSITAPEVFVSRAITPAAGNKPLYLRQDLSLSRIKPTSTGFIALPHQTQNTWTIAPAFQQEFRFSDSTINTYLFLQNSFSNQSWNHTVTLTLLLNGAAIGSTQKTITVPSRGVVGDNVGLFDFEIPISSTQVFNPNDVLALRINNSSEYPVDSLRIYSIDPNVSNLDAVSPNSLISLPAETVINVDEIAIIDSNTAQPISEVYRAQTISIQSRISDPFGSFDITAALISIIDASGNQIINQQAMNVLSDSNGAIKIYNLNYNVPANAALGDWKITVTAKEGTENEISHSSDYILKVIPALPAITMTKTVTVFSDPIHGENTSTSFSKALPGAILTYTLLAQNTGPGAAENNSIWISDAIPAKTYMLVKNFNDTSGNGPVIEQPENPNSGLSYQFIALNSDSDNLEFSENNGQTFDYSPAADSEGIDKKITHFRINPRGIFRAPAAGENANQFSIKFRVQLQ